MSGRKGLRNRLLVSDHHKGTMNPRVGKQNRSCPLDQSRNQQSPEESEHINPVRVESFSCADGYPRLAQWYRASKKTLCSGLPSRTRGCRRQQLTVCHAITPFVVDSPVKQAAFPL